MLALKSKFFHLTLLHSERPKLHTILAALSALGLNLRLDPTLEGLYSPEKQTGSHVNCSPLQKWQKIIEMYCKTLNICGIKFS